MSRGKSGKNSTGTPPNPLTTLKTMVPDQRGKWLYEEFHKYQGSDHACVLIAAECLNHIIHRSIVTLRFSDGISKADIKEAMSGSLRDLSGSYKLAFALGLFGRRVLKNIAVVCEVRNTFAHAKASISFKNAEIEAECKKLSTRTAQDSARGWEARRQFTDAVLEIWNAMRVWCDWLEDPRFEGRPPSSDHPLWEILDLPPPQADPRDADIEIYRQRMAMGDPKAPG